MTKKHETRKKIITELIALLKFEQERKLASSKANKKPCKVPVNV